MSNQNPSELKLKLIGLLVVLWLVVSGVIVVTEFAKARTAVGSYAKEKKPVKCSDYDKKNKGNKACYVPPRPENGGCPQKTVACFDWFGFGYNTVTTSYTYNSATKKCVQSVVDSGFKEGRCSAVNWSGVP